MTALIGILAAAAAPSMVTYLRDRRVKEAARNIADLYRLARSRAMGRGSATMVMYNVTATLGQRYTVWEGIAGPAAPLQEFMPATSCNSFNAAGTSRYVKGFDDRAGRYDPADSMFRDAGGGGATLAQICFTPRGRTFYRFATGGPWIPLNFVPRVEVFNTFDSTSRFVIITPSGSTRVEDRVN